MLEAGSSDANIDLISETRVIFLAKIFSLALKRVCWDANVQQYKNEKKYDFKIEESKSLVTKEQSSDMY